MAVTKSKCVGECQCVLLYTETVAVSKSECVGECQCVLLYTETFWLSPSLNVLVSVSVCYFILRLSGCHQV